MNAWSGRIWIDRDWWCFEGITGDSRPHAHLCAQIVSALHGTARVETEAGVVDAPVIAIPAGVRHRLLGAEGSMRAIYPRPLGRLARRWRIVGEVAARPDWTGILAGGDLAATLEAESALGDAQPIDPRLRGVLDALDGDLSLSDLAHWAGLSTARLRALAQAELGAPLAHWRLWRRLELAVLRVRAGAPLAAAAVEAGFADQSHLNRAMSRFFGITPRTVASLLDRLPG
jgi:AraC-like DNA-binding protein